MRFSYGRFGVEILSASSLLFLVIAKLRDRFSRDGVFVKSYSLSLLHENRTRPKGLDSLKEKITATKRKGSGSGARGKPHAGGVCEGGVQAEVRPEGRGQVHCRLLGTNNDQEVTRQER